jgi:MoaA/NifB/PqqE/SkfB family radical SAM enzyme/SAM-dependent methyltransferase
VEFTGERAIPDRSHLHYEHLARYVFAHPLIHEGLVLDAGCGTGYGSDCLAAQGARFVVGMDISPQAVRYSQSRYPRSNLAFTVGDCLHLPFPDEVFDCVVSFEVIEHLSDHDAYLTEVNRVLTSQGVYIASTPNKRTHCPERDAPYNRFHLKEFYPPQLEALLRAHFPTVKILGQRFVQGFLIFDEATEGEPARIALDPLAETAWDLNEAKDLIIICTRAPEEHLTGMLRGTASSQTSTMQTVFWARPAGTDPLAQASLQLTKLSNEVMALREQIQSHRELIDAIRRGRFMRAMEKLHSTTASIAAAWPRRAPQSDTEAAANAVVQPQSTAGAIAGTELKPQARQVGEAPVTWNRPVELPEKLVIEPFGGCNLGCPLCPTGQGRLQRPLGPMKMELFREILRQLGDSLTQIDFFNWGEPLLNPLLPDMIRLAAHRGIYTTVSTNLNHLLADPAALVASHLDRLLISCSGCTPETYAKYHVGGDFERVMANMARILKYRDLNPELKVFWRFVKFAHNQHEVPSLVEMCHTLGIQPDVCEPRLDMREEILTPAEQRIEKHREWIPSDSSVYDVEHASTRNKWSTCRLPWTEGSIDVDGSVMVCCSSYDRKYDFGNILATPFDEIWNGPLYRAAREYLEAGTVTSPVSTICHICKESGFRDY